MLFMNASWFEIVWTTGAILAFLMCYRSMRYQQKDEIQTGDRVLSPGEVEAVKRYHWVRVVREGANCVTQAMIVVLGFYFMSRPPAPGSTNTHPSVGAILLTACFIIIETSSVTAAILTERLRTTIDYLEKRGIIYLYQIPLRMERRASPNPAYVGPERRRGLYDADGNKLWIQPPVEEPLNGYSTGQETADFPGRQP